MKSIEQKWNRLVRIIAETSFRQSDEPKFPLAFGGMSRFYVDCKQAFSEPEARALIGELILEKAESLTFESVGGLELGAVPIALAVSDAAYRMKQKNTTAFIVRKQPKAHGPLESRREFRRSSYLNHPSFHLHF